MKVIFSILSFHFLLYTVQAHETLTSIFDKYFKKVSLLIRNVFYSVITQLPIIIINCILSQERYKFVAFYLINVIVVAELSRSYLARYTLLKQLQHSSSQKLLKFSNYPFCSCELMIFLTRGMTEVRFRDRSMHVVKLILTFPT